MKKDTTWNLERGYESCRITRNGGFLVAGDIAPDCADMLASAPEMVALLRELLLDPDTVANMTCGQRSMAQRLVAAADAECARATRAEADADWDRFAAESFAEIRGRKV